MIFCGANSRARGGSDRLWALLFADIDHFKSVNDKYGHAVGDAVIREVAKRLAGGVRAYDAVGRYGGEEFLIVLPGCDTGGVMDRAHHLLEVTRSRPFEDCGGELTNHRQHRSSMQPCLRQCDRCFVRACCGRRPVSRQTRGAKSGGDGRGASTGAFTRRDFDFAEAKLGRAARRSAAAGFLFGRARLAIHREVTVGHIGNIAAAGKKLHHFLAALRQLRPA